MEVVYRASALMHILSFTFLVKYLVLHCDSYHHMLVQIVDRPTQGHKFLSREYVQPQWIYDCVNARILLPVEEYVVGRYALNKIMWSPLVFCYLSANNKSQLNNVMNA